MVIRALLIFLYFWATQDFGSCGKLTKPIDLLTVDLGAPFTLNCTYNCSSGFVRGCWKLGKRIRNCPTSTLIKNNFCVVSLHLPNVSIEDLEKEYRCYTEHVDDPQVPRNTEHIVFLIPQAKNTSTSTSTSTSTPNWTGPPTATRKNEQFPGIKVVATITVFVTMILAALVVCLCLIWNRHNLNIKGDSVGSRSGSQQPPDTDLKLLKGASSVQSDRVTLMIPPADNENDTEVPYADIIITIRGVSTPELTQINALTAGDQKEWWGNDSRGHLQASRSADRLHIPQPREVSRKMSTNSEYAVITYA